MRVWQRFLAGLAGLFGAAGVALAAIGAHRSGDPNVTTAAYFLLFHASALMALVALTRDRPSLAPLLAGSLIAAGAILFSSDLAVRALAGVTLVHMAAPTGGVLMILGWIATAIAAPTVLARDRL